MLLRRYLLAGELDFLLSDLYRKRWNVLSNTRSDTKSWSQHLELCRSMLCDIDIVCLLFTCCNSEFMQLHPPNVNVVEDSSVVFYCNIISALYAATPQRRFIDRYLAALLFYCRLATVQSVRLPIMPLVSTKYDVSNEDRCALLARIRQLVPDHAARLRAVEVHSSYMHRRRCRVCWVCWSIPTCEVGYAKHTLLLDPSIKFVQLILGKISEIVATRCQILRLKCPKFDFGNAVCSPSSVRRTPAGFFLNPVSDESPPNPVAGFKGVLLLSRVGMIYIIDIYHWYISDIYPIFSTKKSKISMHEKNRNNRYKYWSNYQWKSS